MKKRMLLALLLLALVLPLAACGGPEGTYKQAQDLLSKGKFTEAAEKFESIGSYEDAATLAIYCKACALCEAGNFETGITALEKLGDYKDSALRVTYYTARYWDDNSVGTTEFEKMERAKAIYNENPLYLDSMERITALDQRIEKAKADLYAAAVDAGENGDYSYAQYIFDFLDTYQDSQKRCTYYGIRADERALTADAHENSVFSVAKKYAAMGAFLDAADRAAALNARGTAILDEKYDAALALMNVGKYEEAISAFKTIKNHKDSATQITACENAILDGKYDAALALMNAEKYEDAITAFTAIKSHKDSAAQITACETAILDVKYDAAVALMNAEKYEDAIAAFTAIKSHKDSAAQIAACETGILDNKYDAAITLMNAEKYAYAYLAFSALNGHKDSEQKANAILSAHPNVQYQIAMVGSYVTFGAYEQDNNSSNGKEAIEWLVLAKENNRLLLISRYALDCQPYNKNNTNITWESCTLRTWLNNDFLNAAFSNEEQAMIPNVTVVAHKNPRYSTTIPGNDTRDKIFPLSITEVDEYFSSDSAMKCKPTVYAEKQGASTNSGDFCWWWLRSPGIFQSRATYVYNFGSVDKFGINVDYNTFAIRPALWIDLNP